MVLGWFKKRRASFDPNLKESFVIAQQMIRDFGAFLVDNKVGGEIRDQSQLPHDKEELLSAFWLAIATFDLELEKRESLHSCALSLALFQKGIGAYPLYPDGIDIGSFDISTMSAENLAALKATNAAGKERYEKFKPIVLADVKRIGDRLKTANRMHRETMQSIAKTEG